MNKINGTIRPNTTKVMLEVPMKTESSSDSGLIIPDIVEDKRAFREFKVVGVGQLVKICKPGDYAVVSVASLFPYQPEGQDKLYVFVTEAEIVAIIPQ